MRLLKNMMVLAGISVTSVFAQKLETQPPDTKKVTLVETARDHLTVIELGDPLVRKTLWTGLIQRQSQNRTEQVRGDCRNPLDRKRASGRKWRRKTEASMPC
jgi:hypothetical protein